VAYTDPLGGGRLLDLGFVLRADRDSLPFHTTILQRNFGLVTWVADQDEGNRF
jgi:hypothetical protein